MLIELQAENKLLRTEFAKNSKLPEWSNEHCYLAKQPEHPERMVSKTDVCKAFGLTNTEYAALLEPDHKVRNKARILARLVKAEAIKLVDDFVMINPAIRLALGWWSPFMYGVFLVDWENEQVTNVRLLDVPIIQSYSLAAGAAYAAIVQYQIA